MSVTELIAGERYGSMRAEVELCSLCGSGVLWLFRGRLDTAVICQSCGQMEADFDINTQTVIALWNCEQIKKCQ